MSSIHPPPHYPEEYTTGSVVFYGKKIRVTPSVLIPRLETEVLVRRVRKIAQEKQIHTLIDIGTGSGCIPVALWDQFREVHLIDISPEALGLAEENMREHFGERDLPRFTCIVSDLLAQVDTSVYSGDLIITANLPYIREADWENMSPDTQYEPRLALFWWEHTGFEMYEFLFDQLVQWKYPQKRYLIIEFWYDQRDIAEEVLQKYTWKYVFFGDYRGIERFCEIEIV